MPDKWKQNTGGAKTWREGSGYGGNVINNNVGTVSGGSQIASNVCNGNVACP